MDLAAWKKLQTLKKLNKLKYNKLNKLKITTMLYSIVLTQRDLGNDTRKNQR